jgi:hypothetical protein
MLLKEVLKDIEKDRLDIEQQINKMIDKFEEKHQGAFVKGIEAGGDIGRNDFKLKIEISI